MGLQIGDTAPNFTTETSMGTISFHDWIGSAWVFFLQPPRRFHARLHHRDRADGAVDP